MPLLLAHGLEPQLTIVTEAMIPGEYLFPLVDKLAQKSNTQISILTEVLAGAWQSLDQGRADIVIAPSMHLRTSTEINSRVIFRQMNVCVAVPEHPIHS